MITTGVVRRIDDLGRIVIPKEIRKNLRIKDGESLEIYVNEDAIILKKHSFLSKINTIASDLVCAINLSIKKNVIITDLDNIIGVSGNIKKNYSNASISDELAKTIHFRNEILENNLVRFKFIAELEESCYYYLRPIIVNGDIVGSIIIMSNESTISDLDISIVTIINHFLEKYLEV